MPVRYAMTMGELAQMFNAENKIGADLHVIAMKDWHRRDTYDQTGLALDRAFAESAHADGAFLYPGVEILQAGGVSVGRGTDAPFELFGAPWIHSEALLAALNARKIPGVLFARDDSSRRRVDSTVDGLQRDRDRGTRPRCVSANDNGAGDRGGVCIACIQNNFMSRK